MKLVRAGFILAGVILTAAAAVLYVSAMRGQDMRWIGYVTLPGVVLWAGSAAVVYVYERRGAARRRGGVTLIELLVVMSIMAIVSVGVGMLMHSFATRAAREGAVGDIHNFLRAASMRAAQTGRGAQATWADGDCTVTSYKYVAAWHLEANTKGAKQMDAMLVDDGEDFAVTDGSIGLCYRFNWDETAQGYDQGWDQWIECQSFPVFDQRQGFSFAEWIRWDENRTDGVDVLLAGRDGCWALGASPDGKVYAELTTNADIYTTRLYPLERGEWTYIEISYSGADVLLLVNGVILEAIPAVGLIPRGGNLIMGDGLLGCIDEPAFYAGGARHWQKHERAQLWVSEPVWHWDNHGYLDIAYHSGGAARVVLGDPYQTALLSEDVGPADTEIHLAAGSVFPAGGGTLLICGVPVTYTGCSGNMLMGVAGIPATGIPEGTEAQWSRIVDISANGMVTRGQ